MDELTDLRKSVVETLDALHTELDLLHIERDKVEAVIGARQAELKAKRVQLGELDSLIVRRCCGGL